MFRLMETKLITFYAYTFTYLDLWNILIIIPAIRKVFSTYITNSSFHFGCGELRIVDVRCSSTSKDPEVWRPRIGREGEAAGEW